jgi:arabinogalactan oligomer / maltooligosaccharide transport system permease protein
VTTVEHAQTELATGARARERGRPPLRLFRGNWWRHAVGILAVAFAMFPVAYVVSASLNADQSLSGASLIPRDVTLDNFRTILSGEIEEAGQVRDAPYLRWYRNSLVVAAATAIFIVMLGAWGAYAFSRFRFKGRRPGMVTLLLIQMYPAFLAVVAVYLILLRTGEVFPGIGLNTLAGLTLVYLGGALGINTWLMKGFFDTIPPELDESARVDGATPAQIFWGVVLPLAAPVLAVVGLISFVFTLNEFIFAYTILQTQDNFTLPVGLQGFIARQYDERWGPFSAGVLLAGIPPVVLFLLLQRFIVHGLTSGSVKG